MSQLLEQYDVSVLRRAKALAVLAQRGYRISEADPATKSIVLGGLWSGVDLDIDDAEVRSLRQEVTLGSRATLL